MNAKITARNAALKDIKAAKEKNLLPYNRLICRSMQILNEADLRFNYTPNLSQS